MLLLLWFGHCHADTSAARIAQLENYRSVLHRIVVMSYGDADMRRRQQGGL